jgi:hypothetical protein
MKITVLAYADNPPRGWNGESMRVVAITMVVLLSLLGLQPATASAQDDASARAKILGFMAKSGIRANESDVSIRLVDLNGDGKSEALLVFKGQMHCGNRGCAANVLDLRGAEARSVGDFIATTLEVLPSSTNGWRDLSLNGNRMIFQNGEYKSTVRR